MKLATQRGLRDSADRLGGARLPLPVLLDEVIALFARSLPYDCASVHTVDPLTVTMSSCRLLDEPPDGEQIAVYEYQRQDVNRLSDLATGPRGCGLLSAATGQRPERSPRYRELLRPAGIADELRAVFTVDGACWGAFAWYRTAPFAEDEVELVHELGPVLARAFRAAAAATLAEMPDRPWPPGVLLVDGGRRIRWATAPARSWLSELGFDGEPAGASLPHELRSVAERARVDGVAAEVRTLGRSGRWVAAHASPTDEAGQVALVLEHPTADSIAPLLAAAYGLTERERALAGLVLRGFSTDRIAARLVISPHTVQDHLKSIFGKVGVRSRRELVGRLSLGPGTA